MCIPWEIWLSINSIFLFYQAILKLVTKEFSSSGIRDFHWPWVSDQSRSFYQVRNRHQFIVVVVLYLKPPGYGV